MIDTEDIDIESRDEDIFDKLQQLLGNDMAMNFISNKFDGIDNSEIREVVEPLIGVLKTQGVEMFSAGDEVRAEALQKYVNNAGSYFGILQAFWPALKKLYDSFKSAKRKEKGLTDEDWNQMMYEDIIPEQYNNIEQQNGQGQGIDPNFLAQQQQQAQTRNPNMQNFGSQQRQATKQKTGLTIESMLKNHASKFGTDGMDKVVQDLQHVTKNELDFDDEMYGYQRIDNGMAQGQQRQKLQGQQRQQQHSDDTEDGFKDMTFQSMINEHYRKFGGREEDMKGWNKIKEETQKLGRAMNVNIDVDIPDAFGNSASGPTAQHSNAPAPSTNNPPAVIDNNSNDAESEIRELISGDDLEFDMAGMDDMNDSFERASSDKDNSSTSTTTPQPKHNRNKKFGDMPGKGGFNREEFI